MAAPIHVKAKGKWKKIEIPSNAFIEEGFDNVVALEELHDYDLVQGYPDLETSDSAVSVDHQEIDHPVQKKTKLTYKQAKKLRNREKRKKKRKLRKLERNEKPASEPQTEVVNQGGTEAKDGEKMAKKRKNKDKEDVSKAKKAKKSNYTSQSIIDEDELPPLQKYPQGMEAWRNLFVPTPVLWALKSENMVAPTSIQALSIPHAIRDRLDILGAAETGSGKTLAFSIPILHHVLQHHESESTKSSNKITKNKYNIDDNGDNSQEHDNDEDTSNDNSDNYDESDNEVESVDLNELMMEISDVPNGCDDHVDVDDDNVDGDDDNDSGVVDDELYNNPPDEVDEECQENEFGCVRVMHNIVLDPKNTTVNTDKPLIALILEPTRELAIQVKNHLQKAAKYINVQIATVVGGMAAQKQRRILSHCPEIIIATPGRLWELLQEGDPHLIKIPTVKVLVVDEADRMVEKGHFEELSKLFEFMKEDIESRLKRQTLVFSATLTMMHQGPNRRLKKKKKKVDPEDKLGLLMQHIGVKQKKKVIDLTNKTGTACGLTEARINCAKDEKDLYLYYFRRHYPGRTLVFANSKDCLRRLVSIFTELGCKPCCLHADMHQKQRLKNLEKFSGNTDGFLLASDVAARGLDIPNVQHVIHYQVPRTIENYVHRSGRTARANQEGLSVMLISQDDVQNYRKIIKNLNRDEELPVFPVEYQYIPLLKAQLRQALEIDKLDHRFTKVKRQNDWFSKAAEEMEIDIEDEKLLVDQGDSEDQRRHGVKLEQLRSYLQQSLKQPLAPKSFSGKYPTKMGKLILPQTENIDALSKMKKDSDIQRPMIEKIARNPKIKRQRVNRQKEKKKKKKSVFKK